MRKHRTLHKSTEHQVRRPLATILYRIAMAKTQKDWKPNDIQLNIPFLTEVQLDAPAHKINCFIDELIKLGFSQFTLEASMSIDGEIVGPVVFCSTLNLSAQLRFWIEGNNYQVEAPMDDGSFIRFTIDTLDAATDAASIILQAFEYQKVRTITDQIRAKIRSQFTQ